MENSEEIMQILDRFTRLKQKDVPKELDDYLQYVARTGDTMFKWSSLKYLFREKFLHVIKHFHETSPRVDEIPQYPNVDPFNYESMKSALLERLELFNAAPFTIQRLCELLIDPRKQYSRIDKFMRALEKNILVVSTIEPGRKRTENENGDSLDSVVNGDLSLDVNVDIDMESESLFTIEKQNGNGTTTSGVDVATTDASSTKSERKEPKSKSESLGIVHLSEDDILPNPKKLKLDTNVEKEREKEKDREQEKDSHCEDKSTGDLSEGKTEVDFNDEESTDEPVPTKNKTDLEDKDVDLSDYLVLNEKVHKELEAGKLKLEKDLAYEKSKLKDKLDADNKDDNKADKYPFESKFDVDDRIFPFVPIKDSIENETKPVDETAKQPLETQECKKYAEKDQFEVKEIEKSDNELEVEVEGLQSKEDDNTENIEDSSVTVGKVKNGTEKSAAEKSEVEEKSPEVPNTNDENEGEVEQPHVNVIADQSESNKNDEKEDVFVEKEIIQEDNPICSKKSSELSTEELKSEIKLMTNDEPSKNTTNVVLNISEIPLETESSSSPLSDTGVVTEKVDDNTSTEMNVEIKIIPKKVSPREPLITHSTHSATEENLESNDQPMEIVSSEGDEVIMSDTPSESGHKSPTVTTEFTTDEPSGMEVDDTSQEEAMDQ